jgi:hypothetical protein
VENGKEVIEAAHAYMSLFPGRKRHVCLNVLSLKCGLGLISSICHPIARLSKSKKPIMIFQIVSKKKNRMTTVKKPCKAKGLVL